MDRREALKLSLLAGVGLAAGGADVGRHALERHHGDGAGVLGDPGLLGGDDVHDDAALEHLGEAALDGEGARGARRGESRIGHAVIVPVGR